MYIRHNVQNVCYLINDIITNKLQGAIEGKKYRIQLKTEI